MRTRSAPRLPAEDNRSMLQDGADQQQSRRRPSARACVPSAGNARQQHRHQGRADRSVRAGERCPACRVAPPERSRGAAAAIMVRLFEVWNRPKPAPASAMRQITSIGVAIGRHQCQRAQSGCEDQQADAAEQAGRIALDQPAGERAAACDRDRPGRDQEADLHRRVSEMAFQIERHRDEGRASGRRTRRSRCRSTARRSGSATGRPAAAARADSAAAGTANARRPRRWRIPARTDTAPRHGRRCRSR